MKNLGNIAVVLSLALSSASFAAVNSYQVTGPLLDVKENRIVVQKGKEKWEIARDKDTKVTGDLKTGNKVTVEYRMTATSIEAKGEKKAEKSGAKKKRSAE